MLFLETSAALHTEGERVPARARQTVFEIVNMLPPPELQAQRAPPPAHRPACAVTGLTAKYRCGLHSCKTLSATRQLCWACDLEAAPLLGMFDPVSAHAVVAGSQVLC